MSEAWTTKYDVVEGADLGELTVEVNKKIAQRWQPFGPLVLHPTFGPDGMQTGVTYLQPMVQPMTGL